MSAQDGCAMRPSTVLNTIATQPRPTWTAEPIERGSVFAGIMCLCVSCAGLDRSRKVRVSGPIGSSLYARHLYVAGIEIYPIGSDGL